MRRRDFIGAIPFRRQRREAAKAAPQDDYGIQDPLGPELAEIAQAL